jgi:hypothetical protein
MMTVYGLFITYFTNISVIGFKSHVGCIIISGNVNVVDT